MITELCRGGLPRIAKKNRIGREEPGSRPTPAITRFRPRAGWGCDAAGALEPAAAERPAVHFTICSRAIEIEYPYSGIFYS